MHDVDEARDRLGPVEIVDDGLRGVASCGPHHPPVQHRRHLHVVQEPEGRVRLGREIDRMTNEFLVALVGIGGTLTATIEATATIDD
ncbi:hypothetical protein GCM10023194_47110 [Planotetraspora phitsanulokensis]